MGGHPCRLEGYALESDLAFGCRRQCAVRVRRASTQAALGSFSFARRRKISRERRQKCLEILANLKIAIKKIEASTRYVSFSGLSTPPAVPGRVTKLYLIRDDGVYTALTQPFSVVAPRGSLSYHAD